jgi:DivIVA domain-containing protein
MTKKKRDDDLTFGAGPSAASSMVTPLDIQQKEFRVSRFGGYRMRDVDEFLDQITEAMTALSAENDRLRAQGGDDPGDIVARAREEAARIVSDARSGSSLADLVAAKPLSARDHAAISAFLAREREFLESLAKMVGAHAEGVRDIARNARRARRAEGESPSPAVMAPDEPTADEAPDVTITTGVGSASADRAASASEPPADEDRAASASEPPADEPSASDSPPPPTVAIPSAPIRVEEPTPAAVADEAGGDPGSLRELFWGEED